MWKVVFFATNKLGPNRLTHQLCPHLFSTSLLSQRIVRLNFIRGNRKIFSLGQTHGKTLPRNQCPQYFFALGHRDIPRPSGYFSALGISLGNHFWTYVFFFNFQWIAVILWYSSDRANLAYFRWIRSSFSPMEGQNCRLFSDFEKQVFYIPL